MFPAFASTFGPTPFRFFFFLRFEGAYSPWAMSSEAPSPPLGSPLPPNLLHLLWSGLHLAMVAKYLTVTGLVVVLYDHVLTFDDEVRVVWTAPRSFAKWMFLFNRYLSEVCLLYVATGFSHHHTYTDKILMTTVVVYTIFSALTANLLAFLRVVALWDKSPRVVLGLSVIFALCSLSSISSIIASIFIFGPTIRYNPIVKACIVTKWGPTIVAGFASQIIFELSVLFLTVFNALSRPRASTNPLILVLYRDSILFFLATTLFRVTSLISVTVFKPAIGAITIMFSWAMITLITNRLLISLRSSERRDSECEDTLVEEDFSSPKLRASAESANPHFAGASSYIELRDFYGK